MLRRRFERVNKIPKPLGEDFGTKLPIVSHPWGNNIVPKESVPAFKQLFVHQPINVMKMNCLERFQELIGSMKKARSVLDRERVEVLQPYPPDALELCVFH
ncbi:MAG: hypothetical protein DME48_14725 [Verrucomicrobia bacterium]|nr:MAG: hypothetical protein DME48_14725 [Verrucomicrobiota bacterium]